MTNIGFNEGKACDAVIGYLEHREAALRRNCCNPEAELHHAPIDFACRVGNTLFVLEHTGIEPFEKYFLFQKYVHHYLDPCFRTVDWRPPQRCIQVDYSHQSTKPECP
jgi:hypothetical protein